jgi:hypothetical protein
MSAEVDLPVVALERVAGDVQHTSLQFKETFS